MNNHVITIRYAQKGEAVAITDLKMISKASNGYTQAFMDACRDELTVTESDIENFEIWVAIDKSKIVGMLDIQFGQQPGILEALFVDPDAKGLGIGRLLFEKCLSRAKALGVDEFVLDSDPEAQAFYEKMGMQKTGEVPSGSIAGRFLPRMTMIL